MTAFETESIDTVVIGGGQAGLSVGYHLSRHDVPFVILDAGQRVGDAWRNRWDSLRLFTPAKFSGLDGMAFPADGDHFPTKDEMADYLEAYARRFDLPVRLGVEVDRLCRRGDKYIVAAGDAVIEADNVVVAMANYQHARIPAFASEIDDGVVQIHSHHYHNPAQLQPGDALVVGAGNSGAEIALDIAHDRHVWLAGRHPGHVPFDIEGLVGRKLLVRIVLRVVFHRVLSLQTPMGRRFAARKAGRGRMLVRAKPKDLVAAGVERVARVAGTRDGRPLLEDGRTIDVANVIWSTGYDPGFSWIDPDMLEAGLPRHRLGAVAEAPGLYFVGLEFLSGASSEQIHGVGRDAARIAAAVAGRSRIRPAAGSF